jgi:hypothetical protein
MSRVALRRLHFFVTALTVSTLLVLIAVRVAANH